MNATLAILPESIRERGPRDSAPVPLDAHTGDALSVSFDSLLSAVHHSRIPSQTSAVQPVEGQMFEAPAEESAQAHAQLPEHADRRVIQSKADIRRSQRRDAGGESTGWTAWPVSDSGPNSMRAIELSSPFGSPTAASILTPGIVPHGSESGAQWSGDAPVARSMPSTARAGSDGAHAELRMAAAVAGPPAATPSTVGAASAAPVASASISDLRTQEGNVAQQVGRLLAASRAPGDAVTIAGSQANGTPSRGASADALRRSFESNTAQRHSFSSTELEGKVARATSHDFDALVRAVRIRPGAQHSTARLHLDPPELGRMLVDVRMKDDELSIVVRTENPEAGRLLDARAGHLKSALEQAGIPIERFDVYADLNQRDDHAGDSAYRAGRRDDADARTIITHERNEEGGSMAESEASRAPHARWSRRRLDIRV